MSPCSVCKGTDEGKMSLFSNKRASTFRHLSHGSLLALERAQPFVITGDPLCDTC
jgi:hypothetical protein